MKKQPITTAASNATLKDQFPPRIVLSDPGTCSLPTLRTMARQGLHWIEYRADLDSRVKTPQACLKRIRLLKKSGLPVLFTLRHRREGGHWAQNETRRMDWLQQCLPAADMVDIEFSSRVIRGQVLDLAKRHAVKTLVSFHDFQKTPPPGILAGKLQNAMKLGCDFIKIACMARDWKDVRHLLDFTCHYRNHPLIVIAMGPLGKISRVLFPWAGSRMIYTCRNRSLAPGQMDFGSLRRHLQEFYPIQR